MKFGIVCDSAVDLPQEKIKAMGVTVVPFYVSLDSVNYQKEGMEITTKELYDSMLADSKCYPKTSTPTIPDYAQAFHDVASQGLDVLCICMTQKFSASYQTAVNAANMLAAEEPDVHIHVIDSQMATALQGALVMEAVRLRDHDLPLEQAAKMLEEIRSTGHIYFTTKDLKYLHHGGRLNTATYMAGSMLNMKPILHVQNGELSMEGVCRGQKHSLHRLVDLLIDYLKKNSIDLRGYIFGTGMGMDCPEYDDFITLLEEKMKENDLHPDIWIKIHIGATIGVHTGPFPVGLGFMKRCEI